MWFAQDDSTLFLGKDFFPWMILAFGGAMVVGNVLALVRPPTSPDTDTDGDGTQDRSDGHTIERTGGAAGSDRPTRPPLVRSVILIVVGLAAAAWALASLLA